MMRANLLSSFAMVLCACGGDGNGGASAGDRGMIATPPFSVNVRVSGYAGSGLVLQNNGGDDLAVVTNGNTRFLTPMADGNRFTVTVKQQPTGPAQRCTVNNASGTTGSAGVTASVICAATAWTVSGTVTGLTGATLVLQNNSGDDLLLNASGAFVFPTPVADGANYAVTVKIRPKMPQQSCTVTGGTGTITGGAVNNVSVNCTKPDRLFLYRSEGIGIMSFQALNPSNGEPAGDIGTSPSLGFNRVYQSLVSPDGKYLYPRFAGGSAIFSINPETGALAFTDPSKVQLSPVDFIDPTSRFAYSTMQASIDGFALDTQTGIPKRIAGFPYAVIPGTGGYIARIVGADPLGRFLFVQSGPSATASGTLIHVLAIATNGTLTPIAGSPFAMVASFDSALDPRGRFLFAAGNNTQTIAAYRIDPVSGAVGATPASTTSNTTIGIFDPTGRFMLGSAQLGPGSSEIKTFAIDPATGALALARTFGTDFQRVPRQITPDGGLVFTLVEQGQIPLNADIYQIDGEGAVSNAPPVRTGLSVYSGPQGLTVAMF